ncbi:MAG: right-handed parallel beta-helix repeat-containing protein [Bacteroidales bacterium]|nr:right-handed parallel beta-helix repeat-containing protein [Bacteroidales bacterium]
MIINLKKISLLISGLFFFFQSFAQECDYIITPGEDTFIDGEALNVQPGQTICVEQGYTDQFLKFVNIHGTAEEPIIITNYNGLVAIDTDHHFGIVLDNCSHIIFSGQGSPQVQYGFNIIRTKGNGFGIGAMSTNIEVKYIEISNAKDVGLLAKTDPDCTFEAIRDNFTMYNTKLHHLNIHDCGTEGMYIGSSKYTGQYLPDCDITVLPHVMEGVEVYSCRISDSGWDGIQVSSATKDCYIYNNLIINDSQKGDEFQMSGILIGGGTSCECYNNMILDGKGSGIEIFGKGDIKVFNNIIVNPGQSHNPGNATINKYGIFCKDVENTTVQGSSIHFFNNTIINPRTHGINYRNTRTSNNKSYNNCIINPGAYSIDGESAYVHTETAINMDLRNNFFNLDISKAKFENVSNYNFFPISSSPLVNTGLDLSSYGVNFDYNGFSRPWRGLFDIGAYECNYADVSIDEHTENSLISISPNPVKTFIQFDLSKLPNGAVDITIFSLNGKFIRTIAKQMIIDSTIKKRYNLEDLDKGIYIIQFQGEKYNYSKKLIKL